MKFATEDDFIEIYELFKKNRKLLPHIGMGHIARKIEERRCIFTDGVVIIFEIYENNHDHEESIDDVNLSSDISLSDHNFFIMNRYSFSGFCRKFHRPTKNT